MMHDTPPAETPHRSTLANWAGVIVIAAIGLLLVTFLRSPDSGRAFRHPAVGSPLTGLDLTPLVNAREPVHLDDLAGRVVVVNYWGTWCPPCRQEFPHMVDLYERYRSDERFRLLSISCSGTMGGTDLESLRRETAAYLRRTGADLPVYADVEGNSLDQYMVLSGELDLGIPLTLLLDRQGVIRSVWEGYEPGDEDSLAAAVEKWLEEN